MYSFPNLELVCCSMSGSNCCFLTCIQITQEADKVVWYSHLLKNFPQFVVIHTVKGFGVLNKAEVDVFLELSCFFDDSVDVCSLIPLLSPFYSLPAVGNHWYSLTCNRVTLTSSSAEVSSYHLPYLPTSHKSTWDCT